MAAGRLDDRDAGRRDFLGEVFGRSDSVFEIRLFHDFFEAAGDRLEVVPREAAVGGKPLGEDEQVATLLRPRIAVHREETADVGEPVLFRRHRAAIGEAEHLSRDVARRLRAVALFALLHEPGVLGKPARVQEERLAEAVA